MGQTIVAKRMPPIELEATGTAPFRLIEVVVDGEVRETIAPRSDHVTLRRELDLVGSHYVYFHLRQTDGNEAWSSPIWIEPPGRDRSK